MLESLAKSIACTCNTIINCGVTTMYLSNSLPLFKAYLFLCVSVHDAVLCSDAYSGSWQLNICVCMPA